MLRPFCIKNKSIKNPFLALVFKLYGLSEEEIGIVKGVPPQN